MQPVRPRLDHLSQEPLGAQVVLLAEQRFTEVVEAVEVVLARLELWRQHHVEQEHARRHIVLQEEIELPLVEALLETLGGSAVDAIDVGVLDERQLILCRLNPVLERRELIGRLAGAEIPLGGPRSTGTPREGRTEGPHKDLLPQYHLSFPAGGAAAAPTSPAFSLLTSIS